jgi:hypothetical protein
MPTRDEIRAALERLSTPEMLSELGAVSSNSYTEDALEVMREILSERGIDPEAQPTPTCLRCGQVLEVEVGQLESKTGCLGFLIVGIGYQPTWFTSKTTGAREVVLRPRVPRVAVRCKHCGLIMFGSRA